jgi:hypothetical protein
VTPSQRLAAVLVLVLSGAVAVALWLARSNASAGASATGAQGSSVQGSSAPDDAAGVQLEAPLEAPARLEVRETAAEPAPTAADVRASSTGRAVERNRPIGDVELRVTVREPDGRAVDAYVTAALASQPEMSRFGEVGGRMVDLADPQRPWNAALRADLARGPRTYFRTASASGRAVENVDFHVLDVTNLASFAAQAAPPVSQRWLPLPLFLKVERPGIAPVEFDVLLEVDLAPRNLDGGQAIELTVEVPLSCRVRGAVRGPSDAPQVVVFDWDGVRPGVQPIATVSCDSASRGFELDLACDRSYVVAVCTSGFRPFSRVVRGGQSLDLGEIALESGETIAGRARVAGEPVRGLVRLSWPAREARDPVRSSLGGRWLRWVDGAFEWDALSVSTDADGRFELHGLAPRAYSLSLGAVAGVYASDLTVAEVRAPARAIELTPDLCRMDLRFFHGGAPVASTPFDISEVGASGITIGTHRTDEHGAAVLWVDPARATTVELKLAEKLTRRLDCPGPGQSVALRVDF